MTGNDQPEEGDTGSESSLARRALDAVDQAVEHRWAAAVERAGAAEGDTVDERVRWVVDRLRHEVGLAGAAAGGAAAIPGVGLATSATASVVELGWTTVRLADLVLTVGALHGHVDAEVDQRRMWVLSVLSHGDAAPTRLRRLAGEMGIAVSSPMARQVPAESLRRLNQRLGCSILGRYGSRRGAIAASRVIPFGIGAALGYGLNSYAVKSTARSAHRFFSELERPTADAATHAGNDGDTRNSLLPQVK